MNSSLFKENRGFWLALATIILVRVFLLTPITVSGNSMDPTYGDRQKLIGVNHAQVARFDVVSFQAPDAPEKTYLKRVIGLPGETVELKADQLYIDGEPYEEPFLADYQREFAVDKLNDVYAYDPGYQKLASEAAYFSADFQRVVPEGEYCVMGDNRLISHDSRSLDVGTIKHSAIKSVVKLVYWPPKEAGWAE